MIISIGGTGFVGKHFSILLHQKGVENISLSRQPDHLFISRHAPSASAISISALDDPQTKERLATAHTMVYLASTSIPGASANSIQSELTLNVEPAIATISKILAINPQMRIVFVSSGGTVYGPSHTSPIGESQASNPCTPYAYGKITIENYLQYMANTSPMSYTILRASNPVGKWHLNKKQGFIDTAIECIQEQKPVTLFGDGSTIRDYLDADELAEAIFLSVHHADRSRNQIFNVGSGTGTSLNQIIELIQQLSPHSFDVERLPSRANDLPYNVLDCSKIEQVLGWRARQDVKAIIAKAWRAKQ